MHGVFRGFKDTRTPLYATGERHFHFSFSINSLFAKAMS
jgi:hypothetical protein